MSLFLIELLGVATAAFGAITIFIRRRHRLIRITTSCTVSDQKVEDSLVKILRENEDMFEAFVVEQRKTKKSCVLHDWGCDSRVKGGDWDRSAEGTDSPVHDTGQSTTAAASEGVGDAAPESWLEIAKSVLPSNPLTVSKGPVYLAKAKDEVVKLWETSSKKLLTSWSLPDLSPGHVQFVSALDVDDQWRQVAAGSSDGYLSLWDIASGECIRTWQQFNSDVSVVKMISDRRSLVSAGVEDDSSAEPVIRVWDRRQLMKPVDRLIMRGSGAVVRIEAVENRVDVTEGDCVRQYDLRNLAKAMKEGKAGELLGEEEDDGSWDCVDVEEDEPWEDGDAAEKGSGGNVSNVFTALNSFLASRSILCKI